MSQPEQSELLGLALNEKTSASSWGLSTSTSGELSSQRMRSKAVSHADRPQAGVDPGFNVDMRVANDRGLFRAHAVFFEQFARAFRIRLLAGETVSAIDLREERAQSQALRRWPAKVQRACWKAPPSCEVFLLDVRWMSASASCTPWYTVV